MPIRALLFDYGSVLVQMVNETPRQQLADWLGVSLDKLYKTVFDSTTAIQAALGEITCDQHWQAAGASLSVAPPDIPLLKRQFWSADDLNDELVSFIRALRPRYKVGLLSNAWDDLRDMLIHRWQIADLFDELIISAEVHDAKPNASIYRLALQRLGALPAEAVLIDDVLDNVEGARAVGLNAIQYQSNPQLFDELRSLLESAQHAQ
jgi:HAD superfamily hydrolase (TIGR01509 family)